MHQTKSSLFTAFRQPLRNALAISTFLCASVLVHAAEPTAPAEDADASAETSIVHEEPTPVPNSKALDESGLSNPTGQGQFKRPLLFAPEDNGLKPENPQIKWVFDKSGSKVLMGGLKLDSAQIGLRIDQIARKSAPEDLIEDEKGPAALTSLSFSWPTVLTKSGVVTLEDLDGKARWSQEVTEDMLPKWRVKRMNFKAQLKSHENSTWGLTDLSQVGTRALRTDGELRACITTKKSDLEHVKVCSAPFKVVAKGQRFGIVPSTDTVAANVYIGDKPVGDTGLVNAPVGRELTLKVGFANRSYIEIASQPVQLDLLDVVESKDGREIILTGRSTQPLGKKKIISKPESHFWSATGIQQDTVWQVALPKDAPTIRVLGTFNLPYTYLFRYERLPKESDRVFVSERSSTGSYSATPLIRGYFTQKGPISSAELSAKRSDKNEFEWTFSAPERGNYNRARLLVPGADGGAGKWVAHHTVYRGYPFEASGRLTGVLTSTGQNVILGEIAASAWLESLGFTQNDILSRQRWGVAARYFKSLTSIDAGGGKQISDFSAANVDLKYNLVRGIWNRDELFGVIGSVQSVTISGLSANLGGFGVYWARTMPRVFADLFELFPLLDYSKYVDVELIIYPMVASGGAIPGTSYNLNFHGKVFWSKRLYGEAGFGLKQFEFADAKLNSAVAFSTAYGTLGIGVIF
jgi:hypothetical protein